MDLSWLLRVTGPLCCASHGAPERAVEKCIHRLEDCRPIGLLTRSQQSSADQRGDLGVLQFQDVTAHPLVSAAPAAPHPFGGAGASGLDLFGCRGLGALRHQDNPIGRRFYSENRSKSNDDLLRHEGADGHLDGWTAAISV